MVCDRPDWMSDPRFATDAARLENVDALEREIEAVFAAAPTAPWLGQHSAEVLRATGCSQAEVDALFADRVVYDGDRA